MSAQNTNLNHHHLQTPSNLPVSASFSHPNTPSPATRKNSQQQLKNIYGCVPTNFASLDLGDELGQNLKQLERRKSSTVSFALLPHRLSTPSCYDSNSNVVANDLASNNNVEQRSGSNDWNFGPVLNPVRKTSTASPKRSSQVSRSSGDFQSRLSSFQLAKKLSSSLPIRSLRALAPYRPLRPLVPPQPFQPIPFRQPGRRPPQPLVKPQVVDPYNLLKRLSRRSLHFLAGPYNYCVSFVA